MEHTIAFKHRANLAVAICEGCDWHHRINVFRTTAEETEPRLRELHRLHHVGTIGQHPGFPIDDEGHGIFVLGDGTIQG